MSYIRQKYEQLFPQNNWSDEQIIDQMFDAYPPQIVLPEISDRTFETDEELHDYLRSLHVIPIDVVIDQLASNLRNYFCTIINHYPKHKNEKDYLHLLPRVISSRR